MTKVWRIKERVSEDILEQLLINRGIKSEKEKEDFFNPQIEDYLKELEIPGIEKSLKRIQKAIDEGEQIVVFGDYDVDGITASAILYKALSSMGAKVLPYIPHREKEGYGLSKLGLEFSRDSGAAVVITVDNGIVAVDQADFAKSIGLDLIITDHHTLGIKKPEAFSIVHSTKMCGAAVAWCLIRDVVKKELTQELLQFVAIATIADMMPLIGLNRALVAEGLKVLNKTDNLGLQTLFTESRIEKGNIKSFEVGHIIAPRINAIGRLEHAIDALRLLCTKDPVKAKRLAKLLQDTNTKRQDLTMLAFEQAIEMAEKSLQKKINVLYHKDWHPGIIGLIAGRVTERYTKPTLAISVREGVSKGSARSITGLNITEVLRSCSEFLVDVGGHAQAAGFSVKTDRIEVFEQKIQEVISGMEITEAGEFLDIEAEVPVSKITKALAKKLDDFEPYGLQNPRPTLATLNMKISDIRTLSNGKHLKFRAEGIDAIAFSMGELETFLQSGQLVNVAYNLEINKFNGNETLQLKVKDIQLNG
ncbi:MAG: single-stranded-DNA-specific exonuclease RecJ [Candidatus Magasanikbacteria bacterium]|nr:single-stranded-DNA-specific exonuclease RecJ [Candidatus Magasanikbacteria bacterium]